MKVTAVCTVIISFFTLTSSQPTHDFDQVIECGCQQELEMLRDQLVRLQNHIILLKEELHGVLYSSTSTTGLFNYCVLSLVVLLVLC